MYGKGLFRNLGIDELAVEAGDVAQRDALGAFCCAGTGVGAVAETEFVHFLHHSAGTALALYLALGEKCILANLSRNEEHCGTVLAGSDACATTDSK